jgi:adenylate cyclase class 2
LVSNTALARAGRTEDVRLSIEIEAKMQVADIPALEARLQAVGARRGPVLLETNTFYDTDHGSLKMSDQGLRVRVERDAENAREVVTITHKGPRAHGKLKQRRETELVVHDARVAGELLNALAYAQTLSFEKRRRRWELDGCHVDIDTIPYLGDYVEIEGPADRDVMAVREKLGLGATPLIRASYIAILAHHLAEHRIATDYVTFADAEAAAKA